MSFISTANLRVMPPPLASANLGKTLNYVVDIKGNRWSENLAVEVETVEELEQIASAQRKLMREAANIATNMRVNYIQVQTLLASKIAENRELKTPFDLLDLQTDVEGSPSPRGEEEDGKPADARGRAPGKLATRVKVTANWSCPRSRKPAFQRKPRSCGTQPSSWRASTTACRKTFILSGSTQSAAVTRPGDTRFQR